MGNKKLKDLLTSYYLPRFSDTSHVSAFCSCKRAASVGPVGDDYDSGKYFFS